MENMVGTIFPDATIRVVKAQESADKLRGWAAQEPGQTIDVKEFRVYARAAAAVLEAAAARAAREAQRKPYLLRCAGAEAGIDLNEEEYALLDRASALLGGTLLVAEGGGGEEGP